jgi:hypothetical protein
MRNKLIMRDRFKKGVTQGKMAVTENLKNSKRIEVIEVAKFSDGTETVTYKFIL